MKKMIALLLAVLMLLSLCACGSAEEEAAAEETAAAESTEEPSEEPAQPMTITLSAEFDEDSDAGAAIAEFADQVGELSDGLLTVDVYYGGSFSGEADSEQSLSLGTVNMAAFDYRAYDEDLPLLCGVPEDIPGDAQKAVGYYNDLYSDAGTASDLLNAEAEHAHIRYLAALASGENAFAADFAFEDLTGLIAGSAAFGTADLAQYAALGFNVVFTTSFELDNCFADGTIDAARYDVSYLLDSGIAEEALFWMFDGTCTASDFLCVNQDWWDGLTADQQQILQDAAQAAQDFSVARRDEALQAEQADLESAGVTLTNMTEDEFDLWRTLILENCQAGDMASANAADALTVLQAAAAYTGTELSEITIASGEASTEASGEVSAEASAEISAE